MAFTESWQTVFPQDVLDRYDFYETHSAAQVLRATNPDRFDEIVKVLAGFELTMPKIARKGGNKGVIPAELDLAFRELGWREAKYEQEITTRLVINPWKAADETEKTYRTSSSQTEGHQVDNVKGRVGLDVEWNPKDGNRDRDLANFRSLYIAGQLDVGVVLTREHFRLRELFKEVIAEAQDKIADIENEAAADRVRKATKNPLGTTTTAHVGNLVRKMERGDDGGCPILAIAVTERCYTQPASVKAAFASADALVPDPEGSDDEDA